MTANSMPVLTPIFGGFRITETDTHYLDAMLQLYNWRLVLVPKADPLYVEKHWCYEGTDRQALLAAATAALAWVASGDDEPTGWRRNGQTGEYGPAREDLS